MIEKYQKDTSVRYLMIKMRLFERHVNLWKMLELNVTIVIYNSKQMKHLVHIWNTFIKLLKSNYVLLKILELNTCSLYY